MNKYHEMAIQDLVDIFENLLIRPYETKEELDEAIANGTYNGKIYTDEGDGVPEEIANFRLEKGEGKVFFTEGSTWVVWYNDIRNRWYGENKEYINVEARKLLRVS